MGGMLCGILQVPQNIIMDHNHVMQEFSQIQPLKI